jgi:hypothetical protein
LIDQSVDCGHALASSVPLPARAAWMPVQKNIIATLMEVKKEKDFSMPASLSGSRHWTAF